MKPLPQEEYLEPVGRECLVPSLIEAQRIFAEMNLLGAIKFGIAHTDDGDCLCWANIQSKEKVRIIKAFNDSITSPARSFSEIPIESIFRWNGQIFKFVKNKDFKRIIRKITCFSREADVLGYAYIMGYENVKIHLIKMYSIGNKQHFLFPGWYIETDEDSQQPDILFPMFTEDSFQQNNINFNDVNWVFIDPGDKFIHKGKIWEVGENEADGLFISSSLFQMSIHH